MRTIIESPYAGNTDFNVAYARACVKHSLSLGEAPMASHLLYTQPTVLDDNNPLERDIGMQAGRAWLAVADQVAVYIDLGISSGMANGIRRAVRLEKSVVYRSLKELGIKW